ncbi:hypothetical protein SAMN05660971_00883 [Halomonas cupida]|uniref:Uncharacterized protein n=1 Tax=Halomonas cupida TaxID=44933 RepID=A0A1M7BXB5_9GAMM|nr:hypothetical protein SAMN05660971_00883 [Halomonas cupida]
MIAMVMAARGVLDGFRQVQIGTISLVIITAARDAAGRSGLLPGGKGEDAIENCHGPIFLLVALGSLLRPHRSMSTTDRGADAA